MNFKKIMNKISLIIILIAGTASILFAQEVQKKTLTRGKMWISCLPNGALEYADEFGTGNRFLDGYPGYYSHSTYLTPVSDVSRIFNVAQINGRNVGWGYRTQRTREDVTALVQTQLVKNYSSYGYNFDPTQPEEYITGTMQSNQWADASKTIPHMKYSLEAKAMVWSFPKYSDFVIIKCKLTNTDAVTFNNFYYSRFIQPQGPYNPLLTTYDKEYMWDTQVSEDLGFIFYDDTSIPPTGTAPVYAYPPGTITGDRGNPGNIKTAGSNNKKLYSPSLYAFSFLPSTLTKNKNGEQKVWRSIVSTSGSAPTEDNFPGSDVLVDWSAFKTFIEKEQPKMSWRDANKNYKLGNFAGSLYERSPRYIYAIGPYDLAPGQSIEWTEIWIAGQMDRNITMLGDTTATLHFVEKGLANLKDNWAAAKSIIQNNYRVTSNIPPPTPADQPNIGNTVNELAVTAASNTVDGKPVSGVNISWNAVHVNYKDPISGTADFEAYKIYQSDISVEGPWKLIKTISVADAEKFRAADKINYFMAVNVGVPYRYCVTSIDKEGNESAKTGFSLYPITAPIFPTNNLSAIRVVPNPFRQESGFLDRSEVKRLAFVNIPSSCTIKIYTLALDLVKTIEHNSGKGEVTWGSNTAANQDYMLTDFAMNVMPGVYVYVVESHVAGHEGESQVGKIVIIK